MMGSFCAFMKLCIHIDINTRFQFDGNVVIPDSDPLYLFISCGSVYGGGLLVEFSKPEYFIGNFVIGFFALDFLDQLLLQGHQLLIDILDRGDLRSSNDGSNV